MRSKFSPILKVISQKIKLCEKEIFKIQALIQDLQVQITQDLQTIADLPLPLGGSPLALKQSYEEKKILVLHTDSLQAQISDLKLEEKQQKEQFKQLQFELEKMQFLHTKEIKNQLQERKRKEQNLSDEMALILNFQGEQNEKNSSLS